MKTISGISFATTADGIRLPVLDVTHPLFTSSIDEEKLNRMIAEIGENAGKRAESFNRLPRFFKDFLARRSFIMAGLMNQSSDDAYVSGLSTMMMKLGPGMLGLVKGRFFDRIASKTSGAMMIRMRAMEISRMLAEAVESSVIKNPEKDLCMINIGGGTASDSINALLILHKSNPYILTGKRIEINILDIDGYGPFFGCESIRSLTAGDGALSGLSVECRHIKYDWKDTGPLKDLLTERKDKSVICSSEGGLFEYAAKNHIINNLTAFDHIPGDVSFTGTALKDIVTVDPIILGTLNMIPVRPEFHGINGLKSMLFQTRWKIERISDHNPRYITFTLAVK